MRAKKRVSLRFLYGVLLDHPKGVLRKGSSVLMTWDFALGHSVDRKGVAAYIKETLAKKDDYAARSAEVPAAAKLIKPTRAGSKGPSVRHERLQRELRGDVRLDLLAAVGEHLQPAAGVVGRTPLGQLRELRTDQSPSPPLAASRADAMNWATALRPSV